MKSNIWRRNVFLSALAAVLPLTLLFYSGTTAAVRSIDDLLMLLSKTERFSGISQELSVFGAIFSALDHAEILPFLPIDVSLASASAFLCALPMAFAAEKHRTASGVACALLLIIAAAVSVAVSVWLCEVNGIRFCSVMRSLYRNIGYI